MTLNKAIKPQVSVVIVTRNRHTELVQCLGSLASQTVPLDELIVVDNNSSDQTASRVKHFGNQVKFPVRHILEKRNGYPVIYNQGLQSARYNWVAFIDDDCVAVIGWYQAIKKAITSSPQVAVILGENGTYYRHNPYSLATQAFLRQWTQTWVEADQVLNGEVLDNKNIVYNREWLNQAGLAYDETRIESLHGAGEDADLGKAIEAAGGQMVYEPAMRIDHKDPQTGRHYWRKYLTSLAAYRWFLAKPTNRKRRDKPTKPKLRSLLVQLIHRNTYSFSQRLHLYRIVYTSVAWSYLFEIAFKSTWLEKKFIEFVSKNYG